jgi:hypothetical protein
MPQGSCHCLAGPDALPDIGRRQALCAAGLGGLAATSILTGVRGAATDGQKKRPPAIRSCIFIFLYGGPSHLDTWDMKPEAPLEVRGEFQPIATSVPGLSVCEHLPRMAGMMHRVALVKSMHHVMRNHDSACTKTFTGRDPARGDVENFSPPAESTAAPGIGSALTHARRGIGAALSRALPHAALPFFIRNLFPPLGQGGGFLGAACDPFLVEGDSATQSYRAERLQLPPGLDPAALSRRARLLAALDGQAGGDGTLRSHYERAIQLLDSETLRQALDISQEPTWLRERYGLSWPGLTYPEDNITPELRPALPLRGQNLLVARRLVEAGVPFVNVYDFRVQGANWDTHTQNFQRLKGYLLAPLDQALAALIEDLDVRGLLDSTLVVVVGEFGRTPRINVKNAGRDHWPDCYSALLAGGGIQGGAVHGASDKLGAYPDSHPVLPGDLAATIFWRFGLDPHAAIHDITSRPFPLAEGEPVTALFGV